MHITRRRRGRPYLSDRAVGIRVFDQCRADSAQDRSQVVGLDSAELEPVINPAVSHTGYGARHGVDARRPKRPSTSTQQSTVVDCRHWYTIQRTAFRIFDRIFD
eukprot:716666-Prorocentrum_minimum.AAC.1